MAISPFLIPYSCPFSLDRYLYWLHEFNLIIWNVSWYMHACESLLSPSHLILTIYEQKFFLGNTINTFVIYLISFAVLICKEQSTHFLLKDKTLLVFHMKYRDCRCISNNGIVIVPGALWSRYQQLVADQIAKICSCFEANLWQMFIVELHRYQFDGRYIVKGSLLLTWLNFNPSMHNNHMPSKV